MNKVNDFSFLITKEASQLITTDNILSMINSIDYSHITTETLSWDKWDFVIVALSGFLGGLCDIVLGRPKGFDEPKVNNDSLFGLGKKIKEYDIKNNPIDFQEPGAFGGNHRLYSNGHDLFRFFDGVRQTMSGEYHGVSSVGWGEMVKQFPGYNQLDLQTALLVNLLHLFKDFWTARSLPIPGMTFLAELNGNQMPELAQRLYIDQGLNLRVLTGQAMSIAAIEMILRVYMFLRYRKHNYAKETLKHKRSQLLLTAHSIAMLFNLGKAIVTKNPFLLNIPQLVLIARYCIQLILDSLNKQKELLKTAQGNIQSSAIVVTNFFNGLNSYESLRRGYSDLSKGYAELLETSKHVIVSNENIILSKRKILELLRKNNPVEGE